MRVKSQAPTIAQNHKRAVRKKMSRPWWGRGRDEVGWEEEELKEVSE
jgi:hypothetical protein